MQPQDITKTILSLKELNPNAQLILVVDGMRVFIPRHELRTVDGATLIRCLDGDGRVTGVFDCRSVSGITDLNYREQQLARTSDND